jgi:hypothetical protein
LFDLDTMADRRYWRIAIGSQWLPLDDVATRYIHQLWSRRQSGYIVSAFFNNALVYVNFDNDMAILYNNTSYAIAYC